MTHAAGVPVGHRRVRADDEVLGAQPVLAGGGGSAQLDGARQEFEIAQFAEAVVGGHVDEFRGLRGGVVQPVAGGPCQCVAVLDEAAEVAQALEAPVELAHHDGGPARFHRGPVAGVEVEVRGQDHRARGAVRLGKDRPYGRGVQDHLGGGAVPGGGDQVVQAPCDVGPVQGDGHADREGGEDLREPELGDRGTVPLVPGRGERVARPQPRLGAGRGRQVEDGIEAGEQVPDGFFVEAYGELRCVVLLVEHDPVGVQLPLAPARHVQALLGQDGVGAGDGGALAFGVRLGEEGCGPGQLLREGAQCVVA